MPALRLFCFGLGYSARVLARRLRARGWAVAGTCQTDAKRAELQAEGFEAFVLDRGRPLTDPATALAGTTHVLSSVPPDAVGDPVLDHHRDDLGRRPGLAWVGYLSTTGVYGDTAGAPVDESAPLNPTSARSRRRVAAEAAWQASGLPVHRFRLSGIYGPGRSVFDKIRAGTAQCIDRPGHSFSRIHVEDIATVLEASIARPHPGAVYNLADDDPAPPARVIEDACALLGVEPPPRVSFDEAARTLSPMALSFWRDNRRIDNRRIKADLGVVLAYPDHLSGLKAVLAAGG